MIITQNGVDYEFVAYEWLNNSKVTHSLKTNGEITPAARQGSYTAGFRVAPKEHVFGGVRFIEAGEYRHAQEGEWSTTETGVHYHLVPSLLRHTILKPVEVL